MIYNLKLRECIYAILGAQVHVDLQSLCTMGYQSFSTILKGKRCYSGKDASNGIYRFSSLDLFNLSAQCIARFGSAAR
jgi:hypothetical protein